MLQNDIEQANHGDGLIIPKTYTLRNEAASPTTPISPQKSRFGILSSSNYTQQPHGNFVSYSIFLTSYWDHFPQTLTQGLGEK